MYEIYFVIFCLLIIENETERIILVDKNSFQDIKLTTQKKWKVSNSYQKML